MFMKYYDKDNREIIIPDDVLDKEIGHGGCATVYRYTEDLCFKYYNRGMNTKEYFLDTITYEKLKSINNTNLVDIKELLYKDKNYKLTADAYILSYYEEKYKDFLEIPSEYLLYNIEEIFKLIEEVSEYKLILDDLKRNNIILTDTNIVLIDPDCWYYDFRSNIDDITKLNINNIMGMFNIITENNLKDKYMDFLIENNLYYYIISSKLFPLTSNKDRAMKVLSKRLKGYKRPIDYVYSMKK